MKLSRKSFHELVSGISASVIESLPADLKAPARGVLIVTEDNPAAPGEDDLLGIYDGIPLPERGIDNQPIVPDRIILYRIPLTSMCENLSELRREIRATVIHELGHFFGFEEDELERMGLG